MTSSTKPEVHNLSHCHQRRTELRAQVKYTEIKWNLNVWFLRYSIGQTNRHTDTLITILRTPAGGNVTMLDSVWVMATLRSCRWVNGRALWDRWAVSYLQSFSVVFTHTDGSFGVCFLPPFVCVSVCFSARYLKTDAARITKIDRNVPKVPGNQFILGSKGQRSKSHCRSGSLHSCECWLLPVKQTVDQWSRHCGLLAPGLMTPVPLRLKERSQRRVRTPGTVSKICIARCSNIVDGVGLRSSSIMHRPTPSTSCLCRRRCSNI